MDYDYISSVNDDYFTSCNYLQTSVITLHLLYILYHVYIVTTWYINISNFDSISVYKLGGFSWEMF